MSLSQLVSEDARELDPAHNPAGSDHLQEMVIVDCVLCGSGDHDVVTIQRGYRIVECRGCGLIYVNPRPVPQWLESAYQSYLPADHDAIANWNRMMAALYTSARRRLIRRFPAGGRVLDVGSAYGRFLEVMRSAGWQVEGLEICQPAVTACRRRGFSVQNTTLAEAKLPAVSFDAVTLFYVLEHVTDPMAALKKVCGALKPGGICIVRVPHTSPLVRLLGRLRIPNELYDPPFHLFDFSPATLKQAMETAGFREVTVEIDAPTRPVKIGPRIVSWSSTFVGRMLERLTRGRYLLPGVSKTAIGIRR